VQDMTIKDLAYTRGVSAVRMNDSFYLWMLCLNIFCKFTFTRIASYIIFGSTLETAYFVCFHFIILQVQIDDLVIKPGIYAITGANGSGKSTLFRVIMSCDSNRKQIDLDSSISIDRITSMSMPSSDVVEISQNFYWPLFTIPIDWIYQINFTTDVKDDKERDQMISRVEEQLQSLNFYQEANGENISEALNASADNAVSLLRSDLTKEKEDWFGDLSGGQKSKVELVRKVFLADECPKILLIDETFAPLDPDSKSLVMGKLKNFCSNSIVLVIYHADVKVDEMGEETEVDSCVPSSDFFDSNLHVENGRLSLRPVCMDL